MYSETFIFKAADQSDIFASKWLPDKDEAKGVIQIAHGMAEHIGRYEDFASTCTTEGYIIYANDHRGHGKTAGKTENLGYFADESGWDLVVEDMHTLTNIIKQEYPQLPIFLFGHSMGSALTRTYMQKYGNDVNGIILSGITKNQGAIGYIGLLVAKIEMMLKGKKAKSPLMDKLSFGNFNKCFKPNRTAFDWLSGDTAVVDTYLQDPFCGEIFSAGAFYDLINGMIGINKFKNIQKIPKQLPIYIFGGDKDPVGNNSKAIIELQEVYHRAGIKTVDYKIYKDGRHEMLNEVNRQEVYRDIMTWLNTHIH